MKELLKMNIKKRGNPSWIKGGKSPNQTGRPKTADYPEGKENKHTNLKKFGLSVYQYEEMFAAQKGLCAICGKPETKKQVHRNGEQKTSSLCVDHDHFTGKNRGLLCYRCNTGIGKMYDDADLLRKASRYLEGVMD